MKDYTTKESGKRETYASGMVRDTEEGKPRFDLLHPLGVPYLEQPMTRLALLMTRGAAFYGSRNWEKATGREELDRYISSAMRHMQQWVAGEIDEDHMAAVMFNLIAAETVKYRMKGLANASNEEGPREVCGCKAGHKDYCQTRRQEADINRVRSYDPGPF